MDETIRPAFATPPGELVRDELNVRGWTESDLATLMGCTEDFVSQLLSGQIEITEQTAAYLERTLEVSADFWLRLQADYDQLNGYSPSPFASPAPLR